MIFARARPRPLAQLTRLQCLHMKKVVYSMDRRSWFQVQIHKGFLSARRNSNAETVDCGAPFEVDQSSSARFVNRNF